ncbi:hypothetical protein MMPV_002453 [Pyropia vietnamensis]
MAVGAGGVSARLLTAAADGGARVTHLPSGAAVGSILLPSPVTAVAWTTDEAGAYLGCADGGVRAVAVESLHPAVPVAPATAFRAPASAGAVTDLAVPPVGGGAAADGGGGGGGGSSGGDAGSGGGLVAAYADGSVRVWAPTAGAVLRVYGRHPAGRVRLALLPPAAGGHPPPAGTAAAAAAAAVAAAAARPPPPLARMVTAAEWTPPLGALGGSAGTAAASAFATAAADARIAAVWATVDTAAAALTASISAAEVQSGGIADGKPAATAATEAAGVMVSAAEEVVALRKEVARLHREKERLAGAGRRLCRLLADGAFPL